MKNVLKICLWIVLGLLALLCAGWLVYSYAMSTQNSIIHPEVTFEIQDFGNVKMELYPEYAPNTVANIIKLVENGYYNNKVIYGKDDLCLYVGRNSEGEVENPKISLIDSSIEKDSENDYEYSIHGEFIANKFNQNTLRHEKGVVTLIRQDYSQYFSNLTDESYNSGNSNIAVIIGDNASNLNGVYAGFGKITEGMDILEKLYNEIEIKKEETTDETAEGDTVDAEAIESEDNTEEETGGIQEFSVYPVIKSASVDTKGVDYGIPETEKAFDYNAYMNDYFMQQYGGQ